MEIGPLRLVPGADGKLKEVEGAWNEYANVVFSESRRLATTVRPGSSPSPHPCSRPTRRDWLLVRRDGWLRARARCGAHQPTRTRARHPAECTPTPAQMAAHVVEFMSKFYSVFPEFSTHDVRLFGWVRGVQGADPPPHVDVHRRRVVRGPVHPLHRGCDPQNYATTHKAEGPPDRERLDRPDQPVPGISRVRTHRGRRQEGLGRGVALAERSRRLLGEAEGA